MVVVGKWSKVRRVLAAILLALVWGESLQAKGPDRIQIDLWIRRPGTDGKVQKGNLSTINIKGMKFDELETYDIQYDTVGKYKGLHLRDLVGAYKPLPPSIDMILLHTANGMVVPVAIQDMRKNRELFLALSIQVDGGWREDFPMSRRPHPVIKDEKPIKFSGLKIVAGSQWRTTDNNFTPWRHLDSLVGIEFVESGAFFAEFRLQKPFDDFDGRSVYTTRCHFCHAVKGVGGTFGPDFLAAIRPDEKGAAERIFAKVTTSVDEKTQLSQAMPKQVDLSRADARSVVQYAKGVKASNLTPYQPEFPSSFKWEAP